MEPSNQIRLAEEDSIFQYQFRPKPELLWFMAVAMVTVVMQMLIEFDPATIGDWQVWAVGIGAAAVRAGAAAFITFVAKRGVVYHDS